MWKGFLRESKLYMNYPGLWQGQWAQENEQLYFNDGTPDELYPGWTPEEKRKEVFRFWKAFPRAWVKFHWGWLCDSLRPQTRRLTNRCK